MLPHIKAEILMGREWVNVPEGRCDLCTHWRPVRRVLRYGGLNPRYQEGDKPIADIPFQQMTMCKSCYERPIV